jgi:hypothetical protein
MKMKKKSPNFIFTLFCFTPHTRTPHTPPTVNKSQGFVYGMCSAHFI